MIEGGPPRDEDGVEIWRYAEESEPILEVTEGAPLPTSKTARGRLRIVTDEDGKPVFDTTGTMDALRHEPVDEIVFEDAEIVSESVASPEGRKILGQIRTELGRFFGRRKNQNN